MWKRKSKVTDFLVGVNGAHLMQPFQCNLCWFRNLQKRDPNPISYKETLLLGHIRRVNLDIIWSRSRTTSYMSAFRKANAASSSLGLTPKHFPQGPWPIDDKVGFQVAIEIVASSLKEGTTSKKYQQYDTVRTIRTVHQHLFESGPSFDNRVFKTTGENVQDSDCTFFILPYGLVVIYSFLRRLLGWHG